MQVYMTYKNMFSKDQKKRHSLQIKKRLKFFAFVAYRHWILHFLPVFQKHRKCVALFSFAIISYVHLMSKAKLLLTCVRRLSTLRHSSKIPTTEMWSEWFHRLALSTKLGICPEQLGHSLLEIVKQHKEGKFTVVPL